jgi:hypothetical protein
MDPVEAIRALAGVRAVSLHDDPPHAPLAVVVVDETRRDRATLRDQVVRTALQAGVVVRPAVYDGRAWDAIGAPALGAPTPIAAAVATLRAAGGRALRRAAVRIVRDLRMTLEAITEPQPVLQHMKLDVCARVVRDARALVFALHELPAADEAAAVAAFADDPVRAAGFAPRHATLALRLAGLARQAELAYWATGRDDDRHVPADDELDEAADFLRLVERHVDRTLTSDDERARDERRRRLALAGGGPLLVVLLLAHLAWSQPAKPLASLAAVTAPGGITGEYFAGESFDRKLFDRTDAAIALGDAQPPDPRLGGEHFSVRWSGYMFFDQPGRWHLCGKADDGQRIWFDRQVLVDDWTHPEARLACGTVDVQSGWYPLRVEYRQATGPASLEILRGPPRRSLGPVPPSALCCATPAVPTPAS